MFFVVKKLFVTFVFFVVKKLFVVKFKTLLMEK